MYILYVLRHIQHIYIPYKDSLTMATRGVKQLQKLTLAYCEHGGSSRHIRDFISSGRIVDYAKANPTVQVSVEVRNGHHPAVVGKYLTGWDKQVW